MAILIIAEHNNYVLSYSTVNTIYAATIIGGDIHLLLIGKNISSINTSHINHSIKKIIIADYIYYSNPLAETIAPFIANIAKYYSYVLAPSSANTKNYLPRVSALLNVDHISDIIEVVNKDTFKRYMYAGRIISTIQSFDKIKIMTVRPTNFNNNCIKNIKENHEQNIEIEKIVQTKNFYNKKSYFLSEESSSKNKIKDLHKAKIIISGGRGIQNIKNFQYLYNIADKIGAAVGASLAAVDAGLAPNDIQIGQTGKVVAPELYIAIGISGSIQHLAGMKESKIIVAINKDKYAPIFQVANYGLIADVCDVLPILEKII